MLSLSVAKRCMRGTPDHYHLLLLHFTDSLSLSLSLVLCFHTLNKSARSIIDRFFPLRSCACIAREGQWSYVCNSCLCLLYEGSDEPSISCQWVLHDTGWELSCTALSWERVFWCLHTERLSSHHLTKWWLNLLPSGLCCFIFFLHPLPFSRLGKFRLQMSGFVITSCISAGTARKRNETRGRGSASG